MDQIIQHYKLGKITQKDFDNDKMINSMVNIKAVKLIVQHNEDVQHN